MSNSHMATNIFEEWISTDLFETGFGMFIP
jgi:hypothetical protein